MTTRALTFIVVTIASIAILPIEILPIAAPPIEILPIVHAAAPPLRVCADPNNLPFTNQRGEGFENRIAELLARDLHTHVEYTWWAQRRGFLRNTLNAGRCDVVIGLPSGIDAAITTQPYYRSTYVFVTRRARHLDIRSFDDPRLKTLRIGVPMVGDDGANAPPAHALARRGIVANVVGYNVYGDYRQESPPSQLIAAVARGDVDVAAAWGPLAGFFAARQAVPLRVTPVAPPPRMEAMRLPVAFDISMATRRGDGARHAMLDAFITRRRAQIDRILAEFHVPRVEPRATQEEF
jgi:mxaJ protein